MRVHGELSPTTLLLHKQSRSSAPWWTLQTPRVTNQLYSLPLHFTSMELDEGRDPVLHLSLPKPQWVGENGMLAGPHLVWLMLGVEVQFCWTLLFFLPHPTILMRESEHHLLLRGVGWKISCLSVLLLPAAREIKVPPAASAEQEMGHRPSPLDTAERESWVAASSFCMMEVRQGGRLAPSLTCWNHRDHGLLQWQPTIKYLLIVVWEHQR